MSSLYPGDFDEIQDDVQDDTPQITLHAALHNQMASAINEIEAALGLDPAGDESTVSDRIAAIEELLMSGSSVPEGVVTANPGVLYLRSSGGTGTTLYIKEAGTDNTGWVAVTSTTGTEGVPGTAPVNTVAPSLNVGNAHVGEVITCIPGTWTGSQPITITYQWVSCDEDGLNDADISGYTDPTYTPVPLDLDRTVKCRVTATNAFGTEDETTPASPLITAVPVATEQLPSNLGFEVDTTDWIPFYDSCTLSRTTSSPITGSGSALLTPTGGKTYIGINRTSAFAPTVGTEYTATWTFVPAVTGNYTPIVQNANGADDISGSVVAVTALGEWQAEVVWTPTAWVAGANELSFRLDIGAGTYEAPIRFDDMSLTVTGEVPSGGGGSWPPPGAWFADDFTNATPRSEWRWVANGTNFGSNYAGFVAAEGGGIVTVAGERVLQLRNPPDFGGNGQLSSSFLDANIAHGGYQNVGEVQWGRCRLRFDPSFVASSGTQNWLIEWHENQTWNQNINSLAFGLVAGSGGSSPSWYLQLSGGNVSGHSYTLLTDSQDVTMGVWYEILWEIKFHPDPSTGYFRMWVDGRSIANVTRGTLLTDGVGVDYCAFGLYLYRLQVATEGLVQFDKVAMGPTRASIGA